MAGLVAYDIESMAKIYNPLLTSWAGIHQDIGELCSETPFQTI